VHVNKENLHVESLCDADCTDIFGVLGVFFFFLQTLPRQTRGTEVWTFF